MKLYGLKNCDTCRKAMKGFDASGTSYTFVDVRADGVPDDDLKRWIDVLGAKALLNTRSTTWRGLSDKEKDWSTDADARALLSKHPTLIKRPVIVSEDSITVGWPIKK